MQNLHDPFGRDPDAPLVKLRHPMEPGSRVRVKESGLCRTLEGISGNHAYIVTLDAGKHRISCTSDEIEPENFPHPEHRSMSASEKAFLKAHSPFGFDDDGPSEEEPAKEYTDAARELLVPFVAASSGLMKAIAADAVSIADRLQILKCIENIRIGNVETDPFGGDHEDENVRNLRVLAEKYSGTDNNALAKRARPGLHVGMKARDVHTQKVGTIKSIEGHLVKVTFDDGSGESYSLMNATMETLILAA